MRLARLRRSGGARGMSGARQWYFSFGANMSEQVLERHGVAAARSVPGRLEGWRLRFDYVGYDGVEPRFANVAPVEDPSREVPVHGVAHLLGPADLAALDEVEDEGVSYARVLVPFAGYDGTRAEVWAYTACEGWRAPGLPSERYLRILLRGAERHGLDPGYLGWLGAQPSLSFAAAAGAAGGAPPGGVAGPCAADGPVDFRHRPGDAAAEACAPLCIAGAAFLVPKAALQQRSFLRAMARDGGTMQALRLLNLAYGDEAPLGGLPDAGEAALSAGSWSSGLTALQRAYVGCWLRYFEAHFDPCDPSLWTSELHK